MSRRRSRQEADHRSTRAVAVAVRGERIEPERATARGSHLSAHHADRRPRRHRRRQGRSRLLGSHEPRSHRRHHPGSREHRSVMAESLGIAFVNLHDYRSVEDTLQAVKGRGRESNDHAAGRRRTRPTPRRRPEPACCAGSVRRPGRCRRPNPQHRRSVTHRTVRLLPADRRMHDTPGRRNRARDKLDGAAADPKGQLEAVVKRTREAPPARPADRRREPLCRTAPPPLSTTSRSSAPSARTRRAPPTSPAQ